MSTQLINNCKKILSKKMGKENPLFFNSAAVVKDNKKNALCSIYACVINAKDELIVMVSDSCWYNVAVDQDNSENVLQALHSKLAAKFI